MAPAIDEDYQNESRMLHHFPLPVRIAGRNMCPKILAYWTIATVQIYTFPQHTVTFISYWTSL